MAEQPRRVDQSYNPPLPSLAAGARAGIFRGFLVVIFGSGPNKGLFVYSGTPAKGNLVESITASNGTDPYGNSYFAGTATYAPSGGSSLVVNLLSTTDSAFFQYASPSGGVQGGLILAVSSGGGTDPVTGAGFPAGLYGLDPAFGDNLNVVGANISFGQVPYTQNGLVAAFAGATSTSPSLVLHAPEQTKSGHLVMVMQGTSPDGTHLGQLLVGREPTGSTNPTPVTSALIEFQSPTTGLSDSLLQLITASGGATTDNMLGVRVNGDANNRLRINADGSLIWRFGASGATSTLAPSSNTQVNLTQADFDVASAGSGLRVAEGSNAKQGTSTLSAGTVVVANTSVTANSRIFLTAQTSGAAPGALRVSARTAGTSFTISSTSGTDTSVVAWEIFEPG